MIGRAERFALWGGGLFVFAVGCALNWRYSYSINPDAVQYVDVARQLAAAQWSAVGNPYWSPVYPGLIALAVPWMTGGPGMWYSAAQLVTSLAEVAVLMSLAHFVLVVLARRPASAVSGLQVIWIAWAAAFLFLHYAATSRIMSPDLLVCACVLAVATALLTPPAERGTAWSVRFGALLALGYYVKAILFPIGVLVLAALLLGGAASRRLRTPTVAAAVWLVLVAPLIAMVSAQVGHVTFGESGRTVYDWWVNEASFFPVGGTGRDGSMFMEVCSAPEGYAWTYPGAVTYPPFYDPSFWRPEYHVAWSPTAQWAAMRRIAGEFGQVLFPVISLALPAMLLLASGWRGSLQGRAFAPVVFLSLALIAAYLPVHIELRFVTSSMLLLTVVGIASVSGSFIARHLALAAWIGALLVVGPLTGGALKHAALAMMGTPLAEAAVYRPAEELPSLGVPPGSRVAIIGNSLDVSWAQAAGLRIVAEVPATNISGALAPQQARQLADCLSSRGQAVDAVLSKLPVTEPAPEWQATPSRSLWVLSLNSAKLR
jgi:hypothetical protein